MEIVLILGDPSGVTAIRITLEDFVSLKKSVLTHAHKVLTCIKMYANLHS